MFVIQRLALRNPPLSGPTPRNGNSVSHVFSTTVARYRIAGFEVDLGSISTFSG